MALTTVLILQSLQAEDSLCSGPVIYVHLMELDFSVPGVWLGGLSSPHTVLTSVPLHQGGGGLSIFVPPAPCMVPDMQKALNRPSSTKLQIADGETKVPRSLTI